MNGINYIAITALCVVVLLLGAAIFYLVKRLKSVENSDRSAELKEKLDGMLKSIGDEFSRVRIETQNNNNAVREEMKKSLELMSERIDRMNRANSEALLSIRDKSAEQSEKQNLVIENAITKMQQSNEKKLDEMRATVDEKLTSTLTKRLDSSFKTVSEQLENLYKSLGEMQKLSSGVTQNVTALNRVLTNVKARGTWAEVQLEGILDQTIPGMYEKNVATVPNSRERVEFAIRIPSSEKDENDILLPVDSKFPMEDYIRLCTAADEADPEALKDARKALEARVLDEAKAVSKYIHIPNTTPFAILYLATEGLYAEIASSRTGLPERIQKDYNIMIAGPSTITALLNSLSMGFRTVAINEKANEVRNLLSAIKTQYDKFDNLLEKAKKKIEDAGKTIGDAQFRNLQINKKLRNVESLEYSAAEAMLGISDGSDYADSDN